MSNLSKNIARHEVACKCECGFDTMDMETVEVVQGACEYFAAKTQVERVVCVIHSAARCFKYNRKSLTLGGPGSNDKSQHPLARAIDFHIQGVSPSDLYNYLSSRYPLQYGIGEYGTFVHLDTRTNGPARW